ncbi:SpoIIE family protein phosphatase [Streptomyces griseorubiginosus]|uniref:SpoIIE family protein phosphatase n=1 Tax=Streptomyces griseorubiginosus TaxID=67304 RepID=UPI002E81E2E8|nr:SpoIIE family protein phosphatase [Streptomyces griseorubiginosus]WUB49732.1 SpoIIE family protein phosphatase [Streptomyces griseorubiginosus]WUB58261.1 SpoIIE family protein phosphatase [Streptomyces griseorubiginosus]
MVRAGEDPIPTGRAPGGTGPAGFRERFLQGEPVETGVRTSILDSWRRCRTLGLSPDQTDLPFREDFEPDGRLVRAAVPVLDRLQATFAGSAMNISVADASGTVLLRRFGEASLARMLPAVQSVPGFVFAEQVAGTNGIGLALAERRPIRVYGAEHFAERSQGNACRALPVRDPLSGRIEGVLCFGYPRSAEDPALDTVIRKAAQAIERRILGQSSARERALLRAYLESGAEVAAGFRHRIGVRELAVEMSPRDRAILMEKAAELITRAQRARVDVPLPDGRRVTLVSRPMTSASGVEGVAIEAVVPGPSPRRPLAFPQQVHGPLGLPAEPAVGTFLPFSGAVPGVAPGQLSVTPPPGRLPGAVHGPDVVGVEDVTAGDSATDEHSDSPPPVRGLVMVGEPHVGSYALAARRRLELLSEAGVRIGTTLDVRSTARELAESAVPQLADFVTVDLPEAVLRGEEPADPRSDLRRTVVHGIHDDCPFHPVGKQVDYGPTMPQSRCLASGQAVLEPDLKAAAGWFAQDPEHSAQLLSHVHSLIAVPLVARGTVLGVAGFYRAQDSPRFGDDDRSLAQELAARAALSIDNARRYTRERAMVLALQRSLLPHGVPDQDAVEVAHRYLPAESDVGGDWYDVIPLSGTRIGLFVGDVVGHGMLSAATMGRLRTAARSFAELDFPPDEVLTHLDKLVGRLDREVPGAADAGTIGATCLYAIYDPTTQRCTMARAGHPPPALVRPDGTVWFPDLPAGPPLGFGGLPFEAAELDLPENSRLVLYTDGLIEDRHRDVDVVLDQLRATLAQANGTSDETCEAVLDTVAPAHPCDDIALLVARTHALDPRRMATWDLPADPALVSEVRASATRQLADWGLEEAAFAAELVLSELVTNAIRHGAGPIRVRLLHDRTLICEVSDSSNTAPHLRRAASTDEGGRGLFLVAQLTQSWGTRYTQHGKVIWAECALEGAA